MRAEGRIGYDLLVVRLEVSPVEEGLPRSVTGMSGIPVGAEARQLAKMLSLSGALRAAALADEMTRRRRAA